MNTNEVAVEETEPSGKVASEDLTVPELVALLMGMITYWGDGKVTKKEQACIRKMVRLPIFENAEIFHRDNDNADLKSLESVAWVLGLTKNCLEGSNYEKDKEKEEIFEYTVILLKKKIREEFDKEGAKENLKKIEEILTELANVDGREKLEEKFLSTFKRAGEGSKRIKYYVIALAAVVIWKWDEITSLF